MKISPEEKRNLLIQRGFSEEEIETGFRDYEYDLEKWRIKSIGPERRSDEIINSLEFMCLRRKILNIVENDLEQLSLKWKAAEQEMIKNTRTGPQAWDFVDNAYG